VLFPTKLQSLIGNIYPVTETYLERNLDSFLETAVVIGILYGIDNIVRLFGFAQSILYVYICERVIFK